MSLKQETKIGQDKESILELIHEFDQEGDIDPFSDSVIPWAASLIRSEEWTIQVHNVFKYIWKHRYESNPEYLSWAVAITYDLFYPLKN